MHICRGVELPSGDAAGAWWGGKGLNPQSVPSRWEQGAAQVPHLVASQAPGVPRWDTWWWRICSLTVPSQSPALGGTMPLRIESSSSTVAEGQTLDLNCVIASPAQATVTWYKRGGSLPARHQVGDTEGSVPRVQRVGVDPWPCARPHGSVQAQMAACKSKQPCASLSGPGKAQMAFGQAKMVPCRLKCPCARPDDVHASQSGPVQTPSAPCRL